MIKKKKYLWSLRKYFENYNFQSKYDAHNTIIHIKRKNDNFQQKQKFEKLIIFHIFKRSLIATIFDYIYFPFLFFILILSHANGDSYYYSHLSINIFSLTPHYLIFFDRPYLPYIFYYIIIYFRLFSIIFPTLPSNHKLSLIYIYS